MDLLKCPHIYNRPFPDGPSLWEKEFHLQHLLPSLEISNSSEQDFLMVSKWSSWCFITEQGGVWWEDALRIKDYLVAIEPLMWLSLQGTQELWKLRGRKIQALGLKFFRLRLGLKLMVTFNEYHSNKNIVHVFFYQWKSAWNNILSSNKNIYSYYNRNTI